MYVRRLASFAEGAESGTADDGCANAPGCKYRLRAELICWEYVWEERPDLSETPAAAAFGSGVSTSPASRVVGERVGFGGVPKHAVLVWTRERGEAGGCVDVGADVFGFVL